MTKKTAFVIMPFKLARPRSGSYREMGVDELDTVYELFCQALADVGYTATRSNSPTDIMRDIILNLDGSDLVLADITSLNPNVMYELGIRHALCKKTLMVTQDIDELPFDLKGYSTIHYGWDTKRKKDDFRKKLMEVLKNIESEADPRFGPVHTYLGIKTLAMDDYERKTTIAKLDRLFHEIGFLLTGTHSVLEELPVRYPKVYRKSDNGWDSIVKKVPHEVWQFLSSALNPSEVSTPSIDLLLSTGYIGEEYNKFGEVNEFVWTLQTIKTIHMHIDRGTAFYYSSRLRLLARVQIMCMQVRHAVVNDIRTSRIFELKPDDSFFKKQMFPDGVELGSADSKSAIDEKVAKQLGIRGLGPRPTESVEPRSKDAKQPPLRRSQSRKRSPTSRSN